MTKVDILDQIVTTQFHQIDVFQKDVSLSPINLLEKAVAICIGLEILKFYTIKNLPHDTFKKITVAFSNESIKIRCKCDKTMQGQFEKIIANCYISKNLVFPKYIKFN